MTAAPPPLSPLMQQYEDLKGQVPDALLLFRMGDFYELFGEDALEASKLLEITLTSRDKGKPNPLPMAGVPAHSVGGYLQRLLKAGKKVAIGEQMSDPAANADSGAKIVRREITRVYTPAIHFDVEGSQAQYLATAAGVDAGRVVLACLDVTTGELRLSEELADEAVSQEVLAQPVRHWLELTGPSGWAAPPELRTALEGRKALVEALAPNAVSLEKARTTLLESYGIGDLSAFFDSEAAVLAAGALVHYALKSQRLARLPHLKPPAALVEPEGLRLGQNTYEHLDLEALYTLIHRCRTAMGSRLLRTWLKAPLRKLEALQERQHALAWLAQQPLKTPREALGRVYDLERLLGRLHVRAANPRDALALGQTLLALQDVAKATELWGEAPALLARSATSLRDQARELEPWATRLLTQLRAELPLSTKEGGIFARGTTPELDRLLDLTEQGERWLLELEARERAATGIPSLKVRYNRVFGYYIEVTSAHLGSVPSHYSRKQTMVGAERFFTEELKRFEEDILTAGAKRKALEAELFEALLTELTSATDAIKRAASALAELDVLIGLSELVQAGWTFPTLDDSRELQITQGRHPLVDSVSRGSFVPNSVNLGAEQPMLLITGPNMGGKSTVMRQTALIVILGQMGAPVPAQAARWGTVSSIHTRIGAHDAIARGQSTFMVEMTELAHILVNADDRSLIVLDEIGRGTSTYDGMSVAWATLEWMAHSTRARTLFATHYHELTGLERLLPGVRNAHMAVDRPKSSGQKLRFLYRLDPGPASESFGIVVAELAGLPKGVVKRAWEVLANLEATAAGGAVPDTAQLSLFAVQPPVETQAPSLPRAEEALRDRLSETDPDQMTPLQALQFVVDLKRIAHGPAQASS